jgi:cytochrome c biogenesis factor
MNFYPGSEQPVPTPDVHSSPLGDLYLNLMSFRPDGTSATVKAIYEPLVPWIWFGGGVIVFGALVGAFPGASRRVVVEASIVKPQRDVAA